MLCSLELCSWVPSSKSSKPSFQVPGVSKESWDENVLFSTLIYGLKKIERRGKQGVKININIITPMDELVAILQGTQHISSEIRIAAENHIQNHVTSDGMWFHFTSFSFH